MQLFYVWYDTFLEELFSMKKEELENSFPKLKKQLELEKVSFTILQAESMFDAISAYKKNSNFLPINHNPILSYH